MASRRGFTLVELLVSLALIIFIMAILSEAFSLAAKTVRDLKAAGDLAQRQRAVGTMLRRDLSGWHFDGTRRLSDPNFWQDGPPTQGFFRVWQGAAPTASALDPDISADPLNSSHNYLTANAALHFAVRQGTGINPAFPGDYAGVQVPAGFPLLGGSDGEERFQIPGSNTYNSAWVEVAWFLASQRNPANGQFDKTVNGTNDLFSLYRRQRLAVPSLKPPALAAIPAAAGYENLSQQQVGPNLFFNSPEDLTIPGRRFGMAVGDVAGATPPPAPEANPNFPTFPTFWTYPAPYRPSGAPAAADSSDLIATDVLSFDVRLLIDGENDFLSLWDARVQAYSAANPNPNFQGTGPRVFDTWSQNQEPAPYDYGVVAAGNLKPNWRVPNTSATIPLFENATGARIRVKAIQIVLRCWDSKTQQTRQLTIVQDI